MEKLFHFNLRRLVLAFLTADIALAAIYAVAVLNGEVPKLFDLDGEGNIGAWWSGTKFFLAGALVFAVSLLRLPEISKTLPFYRVVAFGFVFLSLDEICAIHERLTKFSVSNIPAMPLFRGDHGAWIFIYGAVGLGLLVALRKPILRVATGDRQATALIIAGMMLVVLGGVVVEIAGYYKMIGSYRIQVLLEELLELVGTTLIANGAALHLAKSCAIALEHRPPATRPVDPSPSMAPVAPAPGE